MWGLRRFVVVMVWGLWMGEFIFCVVLLTYVSCIAHYCLLMKFFCYAQNARGKDGEGTFEKYRAK